MGRGPYRFGRLVAHVLELLQLVKVGLEAAELAAQRERALFQRRQDDRVPHAVEDEGDPGTQSICQQRASCDAVAVRVVQD